MTVSEVIPEHPPRTMGTGSAHVCAISGKPQSPKSLFMLGNIRPSLVERIQRD
jgi:hypothetical protein